MFIALTLLAALVLRLVAFAKTEFWYDEAFSGMLTLVDKNEFWKVISSEQSPPAYYILIKAWTLLFGVSDFSMRAFSLLFGLLTIYLLYVVAKKFFGREAAYVVSVLAVVNPFLIEYSMEARTYALYGFLVLLALYAMLSRKTVLFILTLTVLALVHFVAIFYALLLLAFYVYSSHKSKELVKATVLAILVFLLYLGAIYYATTKIYYVTQMGWIRKVSAYNVVQSVSAYSYGVKSKLSGSDEVNSKQLGGIAAGLFGIGLVFGGLYMCRNRDRILTKKLLLLFLLYIEPQIGLLLLGTFTKYNIYVERYLFPSALFFLLLCGVLMTKLLPAKLYWVAVILYGLTTFMIKQPNYYTGMRELYNKYKNSDNEIVFTAPAEYTLGRFYFKDGPQVRLLDPRDPGNTYRIWAFIRDDYAPIQLDTALLISPDSVRIPGDYAKVETIGSYSVYRKVK